MADNNITGFKKLIRYAENLAEYEQGIADGIIDENVFVIVLAEKCAKFKGQTFDWSGGLETADERYIRKVVDEFDSDLTFAVADGIVDTDDKYYFLPSKAPSTADDEHIIATKADVAQGGAEVDTSTLATKVELEELKSEVIDNEEAVAAALNDINDRLVTLYEVVEKVEALSNDAITREKIIATALTDINTRLIDVVKRLDILENS